MESRDLPRELHHLSRLPVRLVFDTADAGRPEGVRRRDAGSRHLLYQAGGLCLDLRVERVPGSARLSLVGQIADARDPLKPLPGVSILLTAPPSMTPPISTGSA